MLFGELNIILPIDIPIYLGNTSMYYDYIFIKSTHYILIKNLFQWHQCTIQRSSTLVHKKHCSNFGYFPSILE